MKNPEKEIFTQKERHLKEGIRPIMTCIGTPEDFGDDLKGLNSVFSPQFKPAHNVDFFAPPEDQVPGSKSPEERSFVISPTDDHWKVSKGYSGCTGIVATGVDKET